MGFFGFGKSAPAFTFAGGQRHTPEEFGYLSVRAGVMAAIETTNALFGPGLPSQSLGLTCSVNRIRFGADMHFAMSEVGVYIWHASSLEAVDRAILQRMYVGIGNGLRDVRTPAGNPLHADSVDGLLRFAQRVAMAISEELAAARGVPAGVYQPDPSGSTKLIVDALINTCSSTADERVQWHTELLTPAGQWLVQAMASSMLASVKVMREQLAVRFG
jgi:hypothetical protein